MGNAFKEVPKVKIVVKHVFVAKSSVGDGHLMPIVRQFFSNAALNDANEEATSDDYNANMDFVDYSSFSLSKDGFHKRAS